MFLTVRDYLLANATLTGVLPNFAAMFALIQSLLLQIQNNSEQLAYALVGITTFKKGVRATVVNSTLETSQKIGAYARYANLAQLLGEVTYTASALNKASDTKLREMAQGLYDRVQTNLAALPTYGLTAATQTVYQTNITALLTAIPKIREGILNAKLIRSNMASEFTQADAAFANVDALVNMDIFSQVPFYNGYYMARKIVATATSSLSVRGLATDSVTGHPVANVTSEYVLIDQTATPQLLAVGAVAPTPVVAHTKTTATKGMYNGKGFADGVYQVTSKKFGFQDHVGTVVIVKGEMAVHYMVMVKNA